MSAARPLLVEIGCEEIPPRVIPSAAGDLAARLVEILNRAGLAHGRHVAWGGSRRLAVRIGGVEPRQADRDDVVLGPPAEIAFSPHGEPTRAAVGFARKQGVDPAILTVMETERGRYAGFRRRAAGKTVGEILSAELPGSVQAMSFPKTMRWGDGRLRWVRPVHWVVALHGDEVLEVELFGVRAGARSMGHRFLAGGGPVTVAHAGRYEQVLRGARVVVDPGERRRYVAEALAGEAGRLGGTLLADPALLHEVADLVEWPGVVVGRIDPAFLELPRELLVTTLRHHQKCFSVQDSSGRLLPAFLAVANTDEDRAGHIRRGNEWVVGGRLEDARFFWNEDRRTPLEARTGRLSGVVFHAGAGTYSDKSRRLERLAGELSARLDLGPSETQACRLAARLAKNDLVTSTVGEFPELQGKVGGLLLRAEGQPEEVARAVYDHYRPVGSDDDLPASTEGCVVAVADRLDSLGQLVRAGERPTGSRDPFGLRRAASGVFRIVLERRWPLSLSDLLGLAGFQEQAFRTLLHTLLENFLKERGYTANEVRAVLRPRVSSTDFLGWQFHDIASRLEALRTVRARADFTQLVNLTKRVDNILSKEGAARGSAPDGPRDPDAYVEREEAAVALRDICERYGKEIDARSERKDYRGVVDSLAELVGPVDRFFDEVLVLDPARPEATWHRCNLLATLRDVLTRYFDVRELAGQADRRS